MARWGYCWLLAVVAVPVLMFAPEDASAQEKKPFPAFGKVTRLDPRLDKLVPADAHMEQLAEGFEWAEGPVWIKDGGYVLFSDIPKNSVMKWSEKDGISVFLKPSGFTGPGEYGREPGCNGLAVDALGQLISCEHGDRRLSLLTKDGGKRTLVDNYLGKRLNSPNDVAVRSNGDVYFTDPPYGLPKNWDDPRRELDFCGLYRLAKDGGTTALPYSKLTLLTSHVDRPNGIAFSPDEKTLYVADSGATLWMAYDVQPDGSIANGRVFLDGKELRKKYKNGGSDGLKVDQQGNLFATGPGGVVVIAPDATVLGVFETNQATANCGWGDDGSTLYICADMYLVRIKLTTKGAGWK